MFSVECLAESEGKNVGGESHWVDKWAAKSGLGGRHVRREARRSSGPWSLSPWFSDTFSPRMQTRAPTRSQRQPAHRALPDISNVADMTPPLNLRAGLIVRYPHSGYSNICTSNAINKTTGTEGVKAFTVRRGDRKLIGNICCIEPGRGISRIAGDRKYRHFDRKRSQFGQPKENPHCCGGAGAHGGRGCGAQCRATSGVHGSKILSVGRRAPLGYKIRMLVASRGTWRHSGQVVSSTKASNDPRWPGSGLSAGGWRAVILGRGVRFCVPLGRCST
ncbi:Uncharacterised protein [Mycobacteroides abscessus]|nr:Uncharacterised protein [Mycobacteroides abscessus]